MAQEQILLLEPDAGTRDTVLRLLDEAGYRVEPAADCEEALSRASGSRPDLLLCRLSAQDKTGYQAFGELRRLNPALVGVVLAAYSDWEAAAEALRSGFSGFLFAPFEPRELLAAVSAALQQEELRRENARLRALVPLYELSRAFTGTGELEEVLEQIVTTARSETHAEVVSLMLLEEDEETLSIAAASGLDPAIVGSHRSALGKGIAGWVAAHGEALMIDDGAPLEQTLRRAMAKPELLSALSLPLKARGETIGVLNLARRRGGEPFTGGDLELASVLAGQVAIAVDKARVIQDMRKLTEASQRLASALDLDEAATIIIETTAHISCARKAAFWLVEESSERVTLYKTFGFTPEELRGLTPPRQELLAAEPYTPDPELGLLWLPIVRAENRFGLIELRLAGRIPPRPDRLALLRTLANTAAAVVESHRLRAREAIAFRELGDALRSELNLQQVLQRVLAQMIEACGAGGGAIFLAGERSGHLEAFVESGLPVPPTLARQVVDENQPLLLARLVDPDAKDIRSLIGVPLTIGSRVEGAVLLYHGQANAFADRHLNLLTVLGNSTALVVRNAQLYARSEEAVIGEERNRIAREIHDGLAQDLSFLLLKLEIMRRLMQRGDLAQLEKELDEMTTALRNDAREVRRTIYALRPVDLEALGFMPALDKFTQDFGSSNDIRVYLQMQGAASALSPKLQTALFRLVQESLNNVRKHAHASSVWIDLELDGSWAALAVRDDGQGFEPDKAFADARRRGSVGMVQMRERAERAGGAFEFETRPGQGTTIRVKLPIK
ncbi:MAG: GAF domain-containing protein [Rudaea sp.]